MNNGMHNLLVLQRKTGTHDAGGSDGGQGRGGGLEVSRLRLYTRADPFNKTLKASDV